MSANVEGEWDEIMPVIRDHVSARSRKQRARATVTIKLDRRPGQPADRLRLDGESVERPLRRAKADRPAEQRGLLAAASLADAGRS